MQGCLLALFSLIAPRLVMIFMLLLTDWFSRAYETMMWPILGFFFMPYTTLAYMGAMLNNGQSISGGWLVLVIIAVVVDLSGQGSSVSSRQGS